MPYLCWADNPIKYLLLNDRRSAHGAPQRLTHDVIKVGNHVTSTVDTGDVTTSNADITLRANKVVLDAGTRISVGSTLKILER